MLSPRSQASIDAVFPGARLGPSVPRSTLAGPPNCVGKGAPCVSSDVGLARNGVRIRTWRLFGLVAASLLVSLVAPAAAAAHFRTGQVAVGYRATVLSPRPSADAPFAVRVSQSDRALRLAVTMGHTVVVIGYLGEPFLRVHSGGAEINLGSPTAAAAGLLPRAGPGHGQTRGWRLDRGPSSAVWHDARVGRLPPGVNRVSWSIPILVDGRRTAITGELRRETRPPLWPSLLVLIFFASVTGMLARRARPASLSAGSIVLGILSTGAAMLASAAFAIGAYASLGTWVAAADELAFAAAGAGVLLWGPRNAKLPAGIALGLLGLAVGLSHGQVFLYGVVLSALPSAAARLLSSVAIAAGLACLVLGGLLYTRADSARRKRLGSTS